MNAWSPTLMSTPFGPRLKQNRGIMRSEDFVRQFPTQSEPLKASRVSPVRLLGLGLNLASTLNRWRCVSMPLGPDEEASSSVSCKNTGDVGDSPLDDRHVAA